MKQYQIKYKNKNAFVNKLTAIRGACPDKGRGRITFYITWTQNALSELDLVTETIGALFPEADYYGNEASGNIAEGGFTLGIHVTCYVFEGKDTETELVWVEKGTAISSLEELWAYCNRKEGLRAVELIPSMAYVETLQMDGSVPSLSEDILIFGGASVNYDNATYDADIIAKGHPRTKAGMAVMLYYGGSLSFSAGCVLGWKGLGRAMEVTESTGKRIFRIDGEPAYSVYEKYLNLTTADKDTLVFPLITEEEGYEFIRTPQIIMPDKSMQMFANIPEGTRVRIAYGDKNTILEGIYNKAAEIAVFRPQAVKAYSCAARRLFWGDREVGRETKPLQQIAGVCGFYTGGEILRFGKKLRVLNQTLALISIKEGAGGRKRQLTAAQKSGDTSLISRLTYFTEKIVAEEQTLRHMAEGFEKVLSADYQVMYYIDLIEGKATFLHGDEAAKKFLPIFHTHSAEIMFDNFQKYYVDEAVVPEDRERVKSVMNAAHIYSTLKESNSVSVNFRVRRNLVPEYTEMRVFKAGEQNGLLTAVILTFKMTDEELRNALEMQAKLREDAQIIGALSKDFGCVYYVEVKDHKLKDAVTEIRTSSLLKRLIPDWEATKSFSDKLDLLEKDLVYEPDRDMFHADTRREMILAKLADANTYYLNVRFMIEEEIRYYQLQFSAVRDGQKVLGIVAGIRSIDEQMKKEIEAQDRLQKALQDADTASRSKTTFLFNMSHDIRTPMNAIKGFTAMAKKYAEEPEKVKDYLEKIDISSEQLLTLINQVLEMSRIESGRIEFDEKPVNIRERFESMVTVVAAQARTKGLEFQYSLSDIEHCLVLADDSRMGQITLNIVGNAIKYTPEGGRIDFSFREIPCPKQGMGRFVLTVRDTGIGMSREFLSELFVPFSREKTTTVSKIQGTGLGMSIVKTLVDLLGGTIEVESEPGKGTCFTITIDLRLTDESAGSREPVGRFHTVTFEGRRALLVEDNEMNREIARDILEEYGFCVEEADDGDVAVDMFREKARQGQNGYYDFILMDIQMPRMNGYEATRAIRLLEAEKHTHIPIIAMTANAFIEDRQNALDAGMDEHLAKPIVIQKLLDTLSRFL